MNGRRYGLMLESSVAWLRAAAPRVSFSRQTAALPRPQWVVAPRLGERDPDRFELKYWVPEALAEEVTSYARPYLTLDSFCATEPSRGQWNTSLYLDTSDFTCYRRPADSSPDRFKLRVRAYGDPPVGVAFFETKRKVKGVIVKTRPPVPLERMNPLLEGTYDELPLLRAEDRRNLEGFLYLQLMYRVSPVVLVRCHRQAFASPDPTEDIRMTIDRAITFQPARGATFEHEPNGWTPINGELQHGLRGPHALLELKFPRIAPPWMRSLVRKLEMWRVGYSKYLSAVRSMLGQPLTDALERDAVPAGD